MTRSWAIEAKFDGSTWTDISSYVRQVSVRRGRATDLDVVEPGVLSIELDNDDGRFTPENTQGAYSPDVKPGVPVRVSVTGGAASTTYRLFTGEVQRWEPVWTVGGLPLVMLEAVDGFEKLERFGIDYASRRVIADGAPDGYWPLGDSGTYRDVSGGDRHFRGMESGSLSSESSLVSGGPGSLRSDVPGYLLTNFDPPTSWYGNANDLTFSCVVKWDPFDLGIFDADICIFQDGRGVSSLPRAYWQFAIYNTGTMRFIIPDSPSYELLESPVLTWSDGTVYQIGFHWDHSAQTVTFYRNGVAVGTDTATTGSIGSPSGPGYGVLADLGGGSELVICEVALWASDQSSQMPALAGAVDGFASDTPSERIERVLDWAGWDASTRDIDSGTTSLAAIESGSALSACQSAASADGGVFYISKTGDATFQGRRGRWEDAAGTEYVDEYSDTYGTVGGAVFEFDDDGTDTGYRAVGWRYDTTLLQNRVVVNSNTQGVSDGLAEDATSQANYGARSLTVNTISNDTDDNAERAVWELSRRKDPHLRVEEVRTLVADVGREDVAGIVELQDRVDVNRRPGAGQDDITAEMRVADIAHEISEGGTRWELTVGLLDASTDQPGIYGEAVYGTDYYGY